jgi:hypothetical protein
LAVLVLVAMLVAVLADAQLKRGLEGSRMNGWTCINAPSTLDEAKALAERIISMLMRMGS